MQLCIKAALKEDLVCRTITAARRLVGHVKKSSKATAAFKEKQLLQKVTKHKLTQDVPTHWNSKFYKLERLLEQRWPVTALLSNPGTSKRAERGLDRFSSEAHDHSDGVSVTEHKCYVATLPMIINMKTRHLQVREDDNEATKALKGKLIAEFEGR